MADIAVIDGAPLALQTFLVTATGTPITGETVTLKLVKVTSSGDEFFDGTGWTQVSTTVNYSEVAEIPGLYRYTVPADQLSIGAYVAITTAPNKGALAETISVLSRRASRHVVAL